MLGARLLEIRDEGDGAEITGRNSPILWVKGCWEHVFSGSGIVEMGPKPPVVTSAS